MTCGGTTSGPITKEKDLYKGTTFSISFRISADGAHLVPGVDYEPRIRIMLRAGAAPVLDDSGGDSPTYFTYDDENIVTMTLPPSWTSAREESSLYYEIDSIHASGEIKRRILGTITVYESADV